MIATTEKTEIKIEAHVSNCFNIFKKKKKLKLNLQCLKDRKNNNKTNNLHFLQFI